MKNKGITPTATAGIYVEVMKQIYDSLDKRFREAISNAIDVNATKMKISVLISSSESTVILRDNGDGMNEVDLLTKYVAMGGGDNYSNPNTIGRIGIGALSVFAIGNRLTINTRKKGTNKVLTAELDFHELMKPENHNRPLSEVQIGDITSERLATTKDEDHFTEIFITDLSRQVIDIFSDLDKTNELIDRLERILPVPVREDDKIFEKLPPDINSKMKSQRFLMSDLTLHIPSLGYANPDYRLFRKSVECVENDVRIANYLPIYPFPLRDDPNGLTIYGYLFINQGKALPEDWQGVNARVKNVTVESNTYCSYIEDLAARVRIGGEIFIDNMDEDQAITTNRSSFAVENKDYLLVADYMQDRLHDAREIVRKHTDIDSKVKKLVKTIVSIKKVFERNASIQNSRSSDNNLFKDLDDHDYNVDKGKAYSLEDGLRSQLKSSKVDFEVIWSSPLAKDYDIQPQEDQFYSIYLNEQLREFKYNVAGNAINYLIAYCGDDKPLVIKKPGKVYLNLDSKLVPGKDITEVEVRFLETLLMLYLNYLRCNGNAQDLYNQTIKDLSGEQDW